MVKTEKCAPRGKTRVFPLKKKYSRDNIISYLLVLLPIIIFNFLCCENPNKAEEKNSLMEYARIYSGTESARDWDDKYWDIIGKFENVNSYNDAMRLNREYDELIKSEKDYWSWFEYSHMIEYQKRRRELK